MNITANENTILGRHMKHMFSQLNKNLRGLETSSDLPIKRSMFDISGPDRR